MLIRLMMSVLAASATFLVQPAVGDGQERCQYAVIAPLSQPSLVEEFDLAMKGNPPRGVREIVRVAESWPQLAFVFYLDTCPLGVFQTSEGAKDHFHWCRGPAGTSAQREGSNVYVVLGGSSFANTGITNPRLSALILGTWIQCLGASNVIWTTEPLFDHSWEVEFMRRFEIPEDLQKKYGFTPLGAADSQVQRKDHKYEPGRFVA